jgi:hypothetical protein
VGDEAPPVLVAATGDLSIDAGPEAVLARVTEVMLEVLVVGNSMGRRGDPGA